MDIFSLCGIDSRAKDVETPEKPRKRKSELPGEAEEAEVETPERPVKRKRELPPERPPEL